MNHTRIPVMGHAEGICHIYVDASYDLQKALPIIVDAKTQYVAACNTVETLLIHEKIAEEFLPKLKEILSKNHVTIKGSKRVQEMIDCETASEEDFKTEYSDYIVTVHLVDSLGRGNFTY
jgi:glutamate-5-semialdehyde dehydrogenase